jgi:predicted Zn-dependent peptidase
MNRSIEPAMQVVDKVTLPAIEQIKLDNGVPVYILNAGEQDVIKIELIYKAGKWYEEKNLVSDFTGRMLREGTNKNSAKAIADAFDFYGANFGTNTGFETASINLYSLTKHIQHLIPLLHEVSTDPVFPEGEFNTIISNRKQRLLIDLEKNDFLANRHFVNALYGQQHPYGRITLPEHFDAMSIEDLKTFFKQHYNASNLSIIVSGKFNDGVISDLNKFFGGKNLLGDKATVGITYPIAQSDQLVHHTEKADSVQSAVAIGNISINKQHPDFLKLSVLNTVFGGYFGSRLMSNIREEKGYTYGIYSSLVTYPHGGFIEIATEVGKEVREATLKEIEYEINLLRNELIDDEELQIVKNYMSGKILRSVDGPVKFSETLKGLLVYGQDLSYIHHLLKTVREVTAEKLQELAVKYYNFDKMYKITVG